MTTYHVDDLCNQLKGAGHPTVVIDGLGAPAYIESIDATGKHPETGESVTVISIGIEGAGAFDTCTQCGRKQESAWLRCPFHAPDVP